MLVLEAITLVVSVGGSLVFALNKTKYKMDKNFIYKGIKLALKLKDNVKLMEFIDKLKDFDTKYKSTKTGTPIKGLIEMINCKCVRLPKMKKLYEKFGLLEEDVESLESSKKYFDTLTEPQKQLELLKIEEDKVLDEKKMDVINKALDKIQSDNMLKLSAIRKVIDPLNITKVVDDMAKVYRDLFSQTFADQQNPALILRRGLREQMLG